MSEPIDVKKRKLMTGAAISGALLAGGLILPSAVAAKGKKDKKGAGPDQAEVTPPEDLMREHGVLDRVLLVYEAGLRKFSSNEDFDPAILTNAAEIVRDFIQNYHEKSEEEAVFPRFKKRRKNGPAGRYAVDATSGGPARSSNLLPAAARTAMTESSWWS